MLFFTRWKAAGFCSRRSSCACSPLPNFFPEKTVRELAELGAAPHRARPRLAGRIEPAARGRHQRRAQGDAAGASRRRAAHAARGAHSVTGRAVHGNSVEVHITRDADVRTRWTSCATLSQPLGGILGATGQRSVDITENAGTDHADAVGSRRSWSACARRSINRSRSSSAASTSSALVEPTDPARRRRPHSGAGAGPARSYAAEGDFSARPPSSISAWSIRPMTPEQAMQTHPPADSEILDGDRRARNI